MKELAVSKGGEVCRRGNGVGVWQSASGFILYDKDWLVVMSDDVVWLCWEESCWGCVRSWRKIWMEHRSMRNDLREAYKVYISQGLIGVGGLPFSLCLNVLLYSEATDNVVTASTFTVALISWYELGAWLPYFQYHLRPTTSITIMPHALTYWVNQYNI